jgi:DNA-binding SARP family transcriptional activator
MRQRAVLALLLMHANEVVSRDRLIDDIWGEEPPGTAVNVLQTYVSQLRKVLPAGVLETRPPGYAIRVRPGELDLHRFEELVERAGEESAADRAEEAAQLSREALALWRGPALADFAYEAFAQGVIARLEELHVGALERRIDADLVLGRQGELVGELRALVAQHPVRERLHGQLMLALYRAGRQAEALEAYQTARGELVDKLGIEPGAALQELERAILRQDPALDLPSGGQHFGTRRPATEPPGDLAPRRSILLAPQEQQSLEALIALAEPMARRPVREVILARLVSSPADLPRANATLQKRRAALRTREVEARAAAFTSSEIGEDIVRLASQPEVDLVLLDARPDLLQESLEHGDLEVVLAGAPCDVGILLARDPRGPTDAPQGPVLVPFGGAEHEWAATEVGAWVASAHGVQLQLLGSAGDPRVGRRDASRLLANAALMVQQVSGVTTEPVLVEPGEEAVIAAARDVGLLVIGLPSTWHQQGLGPTRLAVARGAGTATLLVRGGLRPGGLAPRESLTRFSWTLSRAGEVDRSAQ